MTRKERLLATMRGEKVDRPSVCFNDINAYTQNEYDPDPFNIYNHPSWKPLLELTRTRTDRLVIHGVPFIAPPTYLDKRKHITTYYDEQGSRHVETQIHLDDRTLHSHTRRDMALDTLWTLEHLLKDEDDLEAWLALPDEETGIPDYRFLHTAEKALGDSGLVLLSIGDAINSLAGLLGMENFMIIAMTEPELTIRALNKFHRQIADKISIVSRDNPGCMWRIYGPEYATVPYLPPALYKKYVADYDRELVDIIHRYHGFVRIHQHGNQKDILDYTVETGCDAIDPIEPIPHGDISLLDVRKKYGHQLVLFGNIEVTDLENLPEPEFKKVVERSVEEGTHGEGRGFVLMPSACPLGRELTQRAYNNYLTMVETIEKMA